MKLDFIGVGAAKAGTTWLAKCLEEHPEIAMATIKEVNYFNRGDFYSDNKSWNYEKGIEWYESQFPADFENKVSGEFSVDYLYDENTPELIKNDFPDVKILIVLRTPIERLQSIYWWRRYTDKVEGAETLEQAIKQNPKYIQNMKYHSYIKKYYDLFSKDNVLILLHDDVKKNPRQVLKKTYSFLDVEPNFKPAVLNKQINNARRSKSDMLALIGKIPNAIRSSRLSFLITSIQGTKLYKKGIDYYVKLSFSKVKYPSLDSGTKKKLIKIFEEDIKKTSNLIERDLAHWLDV